MRNAKRNVVSYSRHERSKNGFLIFRNEDCIDWKMNQNQKEIMANMLYVNLNMFINTLNPDERTSFVTKLMQGLQGYTRPITPPAVSVPVQTPAPVRFAKGPPTEPVWSSVLPAIPEIKFEGKIWDSATMLPKDGLPLRADSPAYVPK
jgi:hypothetical protein